MMINKMKVLTLSAIILISAPIAIIVSCSGTSPLKYQSPTGNLDPSGTNYFEDSRQEQTQLSEFRQNKKFPANFFVNSKGPPHVRFGGGMFLDINTGMDVAYTTANFISTENTKTMPGDIYAPKTIDDNYQKWNFSQSKNIDQHSSSSVSTENDFSLTPDFIEGKESNVKNTLKTLFNEELFIWYWTTWGRSYLPYAVGNTNQSNADIKLETLLSSSLTNSPKINLSLSWNQLVGNNRELPWVAKSLKSLNPATVGDLFNIEDSPLSNQIIDKGLSSVYFDSSYSETLVAYYSLDPLYTTFWYDLFNKLLGTPNGQSGLINNFKAKRGELPSSVVMDNFDFFVPYNTIHIDSTFNGQISTTKIDLSKLQIKLDVDFKLTRNN